MLFAAFAASTFALVAASEASDGACVALVVSLAPPVPELFGNLVPGTPLTVLFKALIAAPSSKLSPSFLIESLLRFLAFLKTLTP